MLLVVFGFYWEAQKSLEGNTWKRWPPAATGDGGLDGIYWVIKGKVTFEIWRTGGIWVTCKNAGVMCICPFSFHSECSAILT